MWLLRSRRADLVLAGGVDAPISYGLMSFFSRMEAMSTNLEEPDLASRPFDAGRDGFVLGEGAGFLALTRASDAPLNTLGNLLGYGACSDAQHLVAPRADCSGMAACMSDAMRDAGVIPADIGHISAHGTSTVLNDSLEAAAIKMTFGSNSPPVTALKGAIGHLLGGAGSVQVVAAILAGRNGEVPPIAGLRNPDSSCDLNLVRRTAVPLSNSLALSNSFGFGGHNTSLVVAT
jgi:3-oxoacyl-[acyl-carrier-protein] synthase II